MKTLYRVWQWGIETSLGSHGQSKASSRIIKAGFDTQADALAWAETQVWTSWGHWLPVRCGESVDVMCEFRDLPIGYRQACQIANS